MPGTNKRSSRKGAIRLISKSRRQKSSLAARNPPPVTATRLPSNSVASILSSRSIGPSLVRPGSWAQARPMTGTDGKARDLPERSVRYPTPDAAAAGVENALGKLEGRWKLVIQFHLFGGKIKRFSELERVIPDVSQKMLIQRLRALETDGIVRRVVHPQVPPKVEYALTEWGEELCRALDSRLTGSDSKPG
jgi:DNA-binding HxlR family transcriptional regulator